jgi:hypothetical protein
VQKILTDYGCSIRTRVGLHEAADERLLAQRPDPAGGRERGRRTGAALAAVPGVTVKKMVFGE